jgi:hypothetical protein
MFGATVMVELFVEELPSSNHGQINRKPNVYFDDFSLLRPKDVTRQHLQIGIENFLLSPHLPPIMTAFSSHFTFYNYCTGREVIQLISASVYDM